jgi:amicyanin
MINDRQLTGARLSRLAMAVAMLTGSALGVVLALRTVAAEEANQIKIQDLAFGPPELTVAAGTTVTWVNRDDVPHNVVDKNKAYRSKILETDNSFSFTFANAGTYDYVCSLHPQMKGKIIVN